MMKNTKNKKQKILEEKMLKWEFFCHPTVNNTNFEWNVLFINNAIYNTNIVILQSILWSKNEDRVTEELENE